MTCTTCSKPSPWGLLFLVAAIAVLAAGSPSLKKTDPGDSRPAIAVRTLSNRSVDLSTLTRGKPTLLVFWATWCPACRAETPRFKSLYTRFAPKGLAMLAVNVAYRESFAGVKTYAEDRSLPYPVLYDEDHSAVEAFHVRGTPTLLLLDSKGDVVARGDDVSEAAIRELLPD